MKQIIKSKRITSEKIENLLIESLIKHINENGIHVPFRASYSDIANILEINYMTAYSNIKKMGNKFIEKTSNLKRAKCTYGINYKSNNSDGQNYFMSVYSDKLTPESRNSICDQIKLCK